MIQINSARIEGPAVKPTRRTPWLADDEVPRAHMALRMPDGVSLQPDAAGRAASGTRAGVAISSGREPCAEPRGGANSHAFNVAAAKTIANRRLE
jgi:hypothetical protein